jgi:hypothetical protein
MDFLFPPNVLILTVILNFSIIDMLLILNYYYP